MLTGKGVSVDRIESIFDDSDCMHYEEKIIRKRVLVSADFNTAQRVKHIFKVF
jgi:hypothetical protein